MFEIHCYVVARGFLTESEFKRGFYRTLSRSATGYGKFNGRSHSHTSPSDIPHGHKCSCSQVQVYSLVSVSVVSYIPNFDEKLCSNSKMMHFNLRSGCSTC